MNTVFHSLRMDCRITLRELARVLDISHQRLSQLELRRYGVVPQDQERLIAALEGAIQQRKMALEQAEYICKNERSTLFEGKGGRS